MVQSDHQALVWLFSLKEPNGKIARWLEILAPYDFSIEYRPGVKQGQCDELSRCKSPKDCSCSEIDMNEPLKCGPCTKCRWRAELMVLSPRTHKYIEESTNISQLCKVGTLPDSEVVNETRRVVRATLDGVNPEPNQGTSQSAGCSETPPAEGTWEESPSDVAKRQLNDPDIEPILTAKLKGSKPSSADMATKSPAARHYWILLDM